MTAPTVVAATSQVQPLTDPVTLAVPAGAVVGDLLVVFLGAQSTVVAGNPTANAGTWTTHAQTSGSTTRYGWVGSRVYTAGDPASFAFTYPAGIGTSRRVGQMVAVRGSRGVGVATTFETFAGNTSDDVRRVGHTAAAGLTVDSLMLNLAHWTTAAPNTATPPAVGSGWSLTNAVANDPTGAASSQWQHAHSKVTTTTSQAGPTELVPGPSLASNAKLLLEILAPLNPWAHMTVWDGTTEKAVVNVSLWDGAAEIPAVSAEAYVEPSTTVTAGALPLGEASYPVPGGSVHVYPGDSVQAALDFVPFGGTIVLHEGVHRVTTRLETKRPCIIQNAPGEAAWLDGSKTITGWTANGDGTWSAAYTCKPRITQSGWPAADNPDGVKIPDQCWVNGTRQWVVKDGQTPTAGQVSFNPATSKVTIFGDPAGKTVEVSAATSMLFQLHPAALRGFGVRRSSPLAYEWVGSEVGAGIHTGSDPGQTDNSVYENLHLVDHGNIGLYCFGTTANVTIADCTITDCGMGGVQVSGSGNSAQTTGVLERCVFERINFKKFDQEPTAGCVKVTRTDTMIIRHNHLSDFYNCAGIWYDISCIRTQVVGNHINGTAGTLGKAGRPGVEVELSDGGFPPGGGQDRSLIAGNTIIGCEKSVYVLCTGHHDVVNNTVAGGFGAGGGMYVIQDTRMGNSGSDPNNRPPGEVPWHTDDNRFFNNRIQSGRRQWFITGSYALHGFNGMDYFDAAVSIAGNWAEPAGGGNDFCSIQRRDDLYSAPTTWAAWKAMSTIGDTSKIGGNGQGVWDEAAALVYAVPLEAAWAAALGKPVGWKGVGNPLPEPETEAIRGV